MTNWTGSYSNGFESIIFTKVDVDQQNDVAVEQGVDALPTFYFFNGDKRYGELRGADPEGLDAALRKLDAAWRYGWVTEVAG